MSEKMIVYPLRMGNGGGGVDPQVIGDLSSLLTTDKTNIVSAINENVTNISGNTSSIGNLSNLTTTDKSNLVSAINENVTNISGNTTSIGNLSNLTTTDKSNLVSAINENVTNISGNTTNIGSLSNLTTTDKTDLVSAVNEVNTKFPVSIANGGTGANSVLNAVSNLKLTDTSGKTFPDSTHANYIIRVQDYFEQISEDKVPIVFNADWTTHGYGAAFGVTTTVGEKNRTLALFNESIGLKLYHKDNNNSWVDYSPNGTELYWNQSGSSSTITLSESADNFKRLRIYYKDADGFKEAKDVHQPLNGVTISLSVEKMIGSGSALYTVAQKITISGTSLTFASSDGGYVKHTSSGNTMNFSTGRILVVKVIGYKY